MRLRLAAVLCAPLLLAGCSLPNLDNLLNFSSDADDQVATADTPRPAAAPAAAPAAPGAPDPFCASIAQQYAQQDGFDPATQQRMVQRGYAQCVAMSRTQ